MRIKHYANRIVFHGKGGSFVIRGEDKVAWKFAMLIEGKCSDRKVKDISKNYGFSYQRYYQLQSTYAQNGFQALAGRKRGPRNKHKRSAELEKQIIRYRFLDKDVSPELITQKLRQNGFDVSIRTVFRVFEDYGLKKKGSINAILRKIQRSRK